MPDCLITITVNANLVMYYLWLSILMPTHYLPINLLKRGLFVNYQILTAFFAFRQPSAELHVAKWDADPFPGGVNSGHHALSGYPAGCPGVLKIESPGDSINI